MYHSKIEADAAEPFSTSEQASPHQIGLAAQIMAALMIFALPLLAAIALARFIWRDLKSLCRLLRLAFESYAEAFARR